MTQTNGIMELLKEAQESADLRKKETLRLIESGIKTCRKICQVAIETNVFTWVQTSECKATDIDILGVDEQGIFIRDSWDNEYTDFNEGSRDYFADEDGEYESASRGRWVHYIVPNLLPLAERMAKISTIRRNETTAAADLAEKLAAAIA